MKDIKIELSANEAGGEAYWRKRCDAVEDELARLRAANAELMKALEGPPHSALVSDACMSFRHDFGLLSAEEQTALRGTARLWLEAWGKAILTPSKAAKEALSRAEQAEPEPETCVWKFTDHIWTSGCGERSIQSVREGKYCPFCGKRVEVRG